MTPDHALFTPDSIKKALLSSATCTPDISEALSVLLSPSESTHLAAPKPKNGQRNQTSKKAASSALHGRGVPAQRTQAAKVEVKKEAGSELQPLERLRLATEVVNITLKTLTDATKVKCLSQSRSMVDSRPPETQPSRPLQPRSVNRLSSSPLKTPKDPKSTPNSVHKLVVLAECARTALAALRRCALSPETKGRLPHLQIEMGMSALISKLLALDLTELASKELLILGKRLGMGSDSRGKEVLGIKNKDSRSTAGYQYSKSSLMDLLHLSTIPHDASVLSLALTTQTQIIRLYEHKSRTCDGRKMAQALSLDTLGSPASLINELLKTEGKEKAARHLSNLAQNVLSLGQKHKCQNDAARNIQCLGYGCRFQLRLLSLHILWQSWQLAGHAVNLAREVINPLTRYIDEFIHDCDVPQEERYSIAESTLSTWYGICSKNGTLSLSDSGDLNLMRLNICQSLLEVFELTKIPPLCSEGGTHLAQRAVQIADTVNVSNARKCSIRCRAAAAGLHDTTPSGEESRQRILAEAVSLLCGSLNGTSDDLDQMLSNASSLRKSATLAILHEKETIAGSSRLQTEYHSLLYQAVFLPLNFMVRYVGKAPEDKESGSYARFEKRLALVLQVANPTISSVINIAKLSIKHFNESWELTDQGLQDCLRLAEIISLSRSQETRETSVKSNHDVHVSVSNIYWTRYLALKQQNCSSSILKSVLRKSLQVIMGRSIHEQSASLFAIKQEKLACLLELSEDWDGATRSYSEALMFLLRDGTTLQATQKAAGLALEQILTEQGPEKVLTRVLEGYSRSAMHIGQVVLDSVGDDGGTGISPDAEGFLLEAQLIHTARLFKKRKLRSKAAAMMQRLSDKIFAVYALPDFPIRRLRSLCLLLESALQDTSLGSCLSIAQSLPKKLMSYGKDTGLARLEDHYRASLGILITFQSNGGDFSLLRSSLDTWSKRLLANGSIDSNVSHQYIPDTESLLGLLDATAEFLNPQGLGRDRATTLHLGLCVLQETSPPNVSRIVLQAASLAYQLAKLGFTAEAGKVLGKTKLSNESTSCLSSSCFEWHLASAEYYLAIGLHSEGMTHTAAARKHLMVMIDPSFTRIDKHVGDLSAAARLSQTVSAIALAMHERSKALYHAKRASFMLARSWKLLEKSNGISFLNSKETTGSDISVDSSDANIRNQTSQKVLDSHGLSGFTSFWRIVRPIFDGYLWLSGFLADEGLLLEAQYYTDQAKNISKCVGSNCLITISQFFNQSICARSELTGACQLSERGAFPDLTIDSVSGEMALMLVRLSGMSITRTSVLNIDLLKKLHGMLVAETPVSLCLNEQGKTTDDLTNGLANMSLSGKNPQGTRKGKGSKYKDKKQKIFKEPLATANQDSDMEQARFRAEQLQGHVLRLEAAGLLRKNKLQQADNVLNQADVLLKDTAGTIAQAMCTTEMHLLCALKSLDLDPVLGILAESTIASPSIVPKPIKGNAVIPKASQTNRRQKSTAPAACQDQIPQYSISMKGALDAIAPLPTLAQSASSTATVHSISDIMVKELMLASVVCPSKDPLYIGSTANAAYALELGRSVTIARERATISVEKLLGNDPEPWSPRVDNPKAAPLAQPYDLQRFQADYIDIIPEDWIAVSLSVSEDHSELRLCRFKAKATPFVVCIPLTKKGAENPGNDTFGFNEARAELNKIVELANFSTHDTADLSRKGAKTAWWEARAGLDSRLKDLLINIENIWLGGFRGMMRHSSFQLQIMSKFQRTFLKVLDKYLPSRRKGIQSKAERVALNPTILELFVALGDPRNLEDSDEPILDLLYFVVDVLQFNGERNAYDEIDFDPMVIELQDALAQYHEATRAEVDNERNGHTILILDKKLHCFPWESLPCLAGQAISRLPSLGCLKDRIAMLPERGDQPEGSAFSVDRSNGAYVLNPSRDLQHTQETFEMPLSLLEGWSATVNQTPTESELAETLTNKSLYLYFGHGSGGQFIRSRTIRKMDQCAVALLMGCSSGMLTEAGEFESYGTPINYMHAGAPAVVGTLWDVTDKDIDRFSMKTLEKWGLFRAQQDKSSGLETSRSRSPVKKALKSKGRQRSRTGERERQDKVSNAENVSLDRAVAESRDACILRYLNGAAPVVYGIPVSLA